MCITINVHLLIYILESPKEKSLTIPHVTGPKEGKK